MPVYSIRIWTAFRNHRGSLQTLLGSADFAYLVSANTCCGQASFTEPVGFGRKDYSVDQFTFLHELAHTVCGNHDRGQVSTGVGGVCRLIQTYNYGKRFLPASNGDPGYYSIMAYDAPGFRRSVNFLSSPNAFFRGVPTGDSRNNMARFLNERRFILSGRGDESQSCSGTSSVQRIVFRSNRGDYLALDRNNRGRVLASASFTRQTIWLVRPQSDGSYRFESEYFRGSLLFRYTQYPGVTTWSGGTFSTWRAFSAGNNGLFLRSYEGDYLHRDGSSNEPVNTRSSGAGLVWTVLRVV